MAGRSMQTELKFLKVAVNRAGLVIFMLTYQRRREKIEVGDIIRNLVFILLKRINHWPDQSFSLHESRHSKVVTD